MTIVHEELRTGIEDASRVQNDAFIRIRQDFDQASHQALASKLSALAHLLAEQSSTGILTSDAEALDTLCAQVDRDDDVVWAGILDAKGGICTGYVGPTIPGLLGLTKPTVRDVNAALATARNLETVRMPVIQGGKTLGTAVVVASTASLAAARQEPMPSSVRSAPRVGRPSSVCRNAPSPASLKVGRRRCPAFSVVAVLGLMVIFGLSLLIARSLIRQIDRLRESFTALAAGDLTCRVTALRSDEMGAMATAYNHAVGAMSGSCARLARASPGCGIVPAAHHGQRRAEHQRHPHG